MVRNDPDALTQVRQALLGFCVCIAVFWGGLVVMVEPREKILQEKLRHLQELTGASSGQLLEMLIASEKNFSQENEALQQKNAVLKLQEALLRENWQSLGDPDRFNQVVFAMHPSSGISLPESLGQLNSKEKIIKDGYSLYPVTLQGDGYFSDFFDYLLHLEQRPEVGYINNVSIATIREGQPDRHRKIHFKIDIGRISIQ